MGIWLHTHTVTPTDVFPDSDLGELAEILGNLSEQTMTLHYSSRLHITAVISGILSIPVTVTLF